MSSKTRNEECVKVAMRCRPISKQEQLDNRQEIVKIDPERGEIIVNNPKGEGSESKNVFTFDVVINQKSTQEHVYKMTALPIVESVLEGYNGTIFAYGQTGTGKTHTMEGNNESPDNRGIIPRTFEHIYRVIEGTPSKQFLVRASFLELYNEEIRDLLSKNAKNKLQLHENPDSGVYVKDLSSFIIQNPNEMKEKLAHGRENRKVGATKMNEGSSRSHSLFMITVEMSEIRDGQQHIKVGKLNLVDLAGSERQSKTQATGERFKEAININQSLATLGNVISALVDSKPYIPYRDSKLTRLLQDSLGGNTKTVMIANIGPADYNYDETISTLRYANRAKSIKNRPKINEDPKDAMIREFQEEINRLKVELQRKMGGNIQIGPDGKIAKVVEVQKVVVVTDEQKLKELEEQIEREKNLLESTVGKKREQIERDLADSREQKEKLERQLKEKEEHVAKQAQEQEKYIQQIREMESKIMVGNKLKETQREKEKQLIKVQIELEEKKQEERRKQEELEKNNALVIEANKQYKNLQEEIEAKTKKLNNIVERIKQAREQTNEIHEYRLREKEILLDENRTITKELKLIDLIIEHFIPQNEVKKLEQKLIFSEEDGDWNIREDANESHKVSRPASVFGFKRPICESARMAIKFGDSNPRFRTDNVLQLDLELPEKITEDFDGNVSQKVQETINIALNEDEEELQMMANEKMPIVYIKNPELISKENALNQPRVRLKSAKKTSRRPQSGLKKYQY
ncbi:hypothetical protein ABPG74_021479 [Tetrahymena malaccensis]